MKGDNDLSNDLMQSPEIKEVESQALLIPTQAKAIQITSSEEYLKAADLWRNIRSVRNKLSITFDPLIKQANDLHRNILARKNDLDRPLESAERQVKAAMSTYQREQEHLAIAEQTRIQVEVATKQQDIIIQQAIAAEAMGDSRTATTILSQPINPPTVVVKADIPKTKGVVFQTRWKFEIIDESLIPRDYLTPDLEKIRKVVNAMKSQTKIDGVRVIQYEA